MIEQRQKEYCVRYAQRVYRKYMARLGRNTRARTYHKMWNVFPFGVTLMRDKVEDKAQQTLAQFLKATLEIYQLRVKLVTYHQKVVAMQRHIKAYLNKYDLRLWGLSEAWELSRA